MTAENTVFQPMPDLTSEQYEALRADIVTNGVLVPVTVDQHGRIIDGHNRHAIATDLGIPCPTTTVVVEDDTAAMDLAVTLNGARRHLTQEQKRVLIRHELLRRPDDSDRAIARRVGCSPTTVGTIRAEARREAEERTKAAQEAISKATTALRRACMDIILGGADPDLVLERLALGRDTASADAHRALADGEGDVAVAWHLSTHFMYSATYNDIGDILDDVRGSGIELPLPATMASDVIDDLVQRIYPMRPPVQSGHATEAVAR